MADQGKHRDITIPTDNKIDSFDGGVRAKNTDKSPSDSCKPFSGYVGSWFSKMPRGENTIASTVRCWG